MQVPIFDMWTEPTAIEGAYLVRSGFVKADGTEITFYANHPEGCIDWVLNDACAFLTDATKSGALLKRSMLVSLAATYGLKLTEDLSLFDDGTGDFAERKYRFAQCLVAFDGILRMWGAAAPVRIDPEMEPNDGKT